MQDAGKGGGEGLGVVGDLVAVVAGGGAGAGHNLVEGWQPIR